VALTLATVCLAFVAFSVDAAVQVFSISEDPIPVNFSDREFQIPEFDPSLGILRSITIDIQGTGLFWQRVETRGRLEGNVAINQKLSLVLETSTDQRLVFLSQTENHQYSALNSRGNRSDGGSYGQWYNYEVTASAQKTLNSAADLMQFTGSDFVDLFLSGTEVVRNHLSRTCGLIQALVTAGADIKVTYCYDAVPEPAAWSIAGCALLALALVGLPKSRGASRASTRN
jgi:hypothetical protein